MTKAKTVEINLEDLIKEADKYFYGFTSFECTGDAERFEFRYTSEYSRPPLNAELLIKFTEFFGTTKIDVDEEISEPGCETCNYGSEYGNIIIVKGATKNNPFL